MREWITGRNAAYEVVQARRRDIFLLRIAQGVQEKGRLAEIVAECTQRDIPIERVARPILDQITPEHQGLALQTSSYPYSSLDEMISTAHKQDEPPFLLILDTLQDPQNLGTLLRTAEIVGVHGVLLPLRRTATVTPAVVNASSGASEHLLVAQTNLAQAMRTLKDENIWIVGLDTDPDAGLSKDINLGGPITLVVGSEASGMRRLTRESCDTLLQLPMRGRIDSLNAAVAGSIALYLAWQARQFKGYQKKAVDDSLKY
jgi:23S rRNA (guanosine2251-2'-O)-methyltransferase